jgi:hypothetical protein
MFSPYAGQTVALLTCHQKQAALKPALASLKIRLAVDAGWNTDQLGSFTGDIPRAGDMLDAARAKARMALQRSGLSLALASEGSFGPDPVSGLSAWNTELLLWVDTRRDIEVVVWHGSAQTNYQQTTAKHWAEVHAFTERAGFPEHAIVVGRGPTQPYVKGIRALGELQHHCNRLWALQPQVYLSTDMRAMHNPLRMRHIHQLGQQLAARLLSPCPQCQSPGFGVHQPIAGLPCADCGTATLQHKAHEYRCQQCPFIERRTLPVTFADPQHCPLCNP